MEPANKKRLFMAIACKPPPAVIDLLGELQIQARDPAVGLRVVEAVNLHITLKFIGMVPDPDIVLICEVMDQVASCNRRFPLSLEGAGNFHS